MATPLDGVVEAVRHRMGEEVRKFLTGRQRPPLHLFALDGSDRGLFGPGSAAWQVHADLSLTVGAVRALVLQSLHPLTIAAVADHSGFRTDPMGRLHRTAEFVTLTTFGTTEAAEAAIRRVRGVHRKVVGVAPDGRPYAASDPHLLTWVHVAEVDSFLAAYRRYGAAPLDDRRADQYVREMAVVAEKLGAADVPRSVAELDASIRSFRPELAAGRLARDALRFLVLPPWPLAARGPYTVVAAAALGLLPGWARRMLWVPPAPVTNAVVVRPAATALLRVMGWAMAPPRLRQPAGGTGVGSAA